MGKISDLWVKLGLKKEGFDKGMDDVKKKTKETEGVFSRIKGAGVAVWAAIGSSVIAFGKQLITATNEMEDAWAMFTSKAKAGWDSFVRAIANNSTWSAFIADFKTSLAAAGKLTEALDADTEILNSIKLQKARMGKELAQLEIAMRDQTKSYAERAAAAQKYLAMVDPIYQKEIDRLKRLKDAQYEAFMAGSRWTDPTAASNPRNQQIWEEMLVAYGDTSKIPELYYMTFAEALRMPHMQDELNAYAKERFGLGKTVGNWLTAFYGHYESGRNGTDVQALVNAILAAYDADKAYDAETRRVQGVYNSALAGMQKAAAEEQKIFTDAMEYVEQSLEESLNDIINEPVEIEVEPIEFDFTENEKQLEEFKEKWRKNIEEIAALNEQFNAALNESIVGGVQAMTDAIMGLEGADATAVLSALMNPFADMAIQLGSMLIATGTGVEAFKKSLENLDGPVALAAGVALVALGSAMKSGIQALANRGAGSSTSTGSYTGGSSAADVQNYTSELTIYVEGRISGSDIVLAGNKTLNKWRR